AVTPAVTAAICHHAARPRQAREPMHRVDLMDKPLVGDAGGIRPEEAKLEIFSGIERFEGLIDQEALPGGVRFAKQRDECGTARVARRSFMGCGMGFST